MPKYYRKKSYHWKYHHKRYYPLRTFVTVVAVFTSVLACISFAIFLSPSLFFTLLDRLPPTIAGTIFFDVMVRGTGLLVFVIVSAILWYVRGKIRR